MSGACRHRLLIGDAKADEFRELPGHCNLLVLILPVSNRLKRTSFESVTPEFLVGTSPGFMDFVASVNPGFMDFVASAKIHQFFLVCETF